MNAAEITTVEEAAAFFTAQAKLRPEFKVGILIQKNLGDGDVEHTFAQPVRAVFNAVSKRIEIEVEP